MISSSLSTEMAKTGSTAWNSQDGHGVNRRIFHRRIFHRRGASSTVASSTLASSTVASSTVASSTVAWVRCLIATDTTTTAIETIDIILCFVAF